MKRQILILLGGCALLTSCGIYGSYERPAEISEIQGLYRDAISMNDTLAVTDTANFGNLPWRHVFTEPQLQALIEKALVNNADVQKAEMNVQKMKAGLKVSRLSYLPSLAFTPEGRVSSFDGHKATQMYTLPLAANWDLGNVGGKRNQLQQSKANLAMTKAAHQATQTAIIAGVANMYYTLEMLDEQLATTKSTIVLWKKNVEAMEAMKEAGMTNAAAVAQTKANYYELLSSVPALESSIRQVENSLCVLLGEAPHAVTRGTFTESPLKVDLSVGLPAHLLSNRPDVQIAEYNLASNFYKLNIARSAFYPSLKLTGVAGWTNNGGAVEINPAKFIANAIGNLVQPIFANGKLMANLKISKLDVEAAELDFRQALLQAGQEVSDALNKYQAAVQQQALREQKVAELAQTLENTELLFKYGNRTSYLEKLTAEQSLLSGKLALINDKFNKVQSTISLYKALGGGRN